MHEASGQQIADSVEIVLQYLANSGFDGQHRFTNETKRSSNGEVTSHFCSIMSFLNLMKR